MSTPDKPNNSIPVDILNQQEKEGIAARIVGEHHNKRESNKGLLNANGAAENQRENYQDYLNSSSVVTSTHGTVEHNVQPPGTKPVDWSDYEKGKHEQAALKEKVATIESVLPEETQAAKQASNAARKSAAGTPATVSSATHDAPPVDLSSSTTTVSAGGTSTGPSTASTATASATVPPVEAKASPSVEAPASAATTSAGTANPTPAGTTNTTTPPAAEAGATPAAVATEAGKEAAKAATKVEWGKLLSESRDGTFASHLKDAAAREAEFGKMGFVRKTVGGIRAKFGQGTTMGNIGRGVGLGAIIVAGGKGVVDMGSFIGEKIGMLDPKTDPNTGKPAPADMGKFIVALAELGGAAAGTYWMARGGAKMATRTPSP